MVNVRTRFAPSPTGTFHIGGARTALYNFLFTKHEGGTFVLRIEDTDKVRSTPESLQTIYDALNWLGIKWNEGPYFQSQRLDKYKETAEKLLSTGRAYKRDDIGKGTAVVFKIDHGYIEWTDCIHSKIGRDISQDPDLVIMKSDGFPTYNFACVVDDIDLNITHVIRGDDHISNTPKQISLFRALDKPIPNFAHIPLILNPDGSKMSKDYKKKGTGGKEETIPTSVLEYKKLGFLPEAFMNFLALLGWAPGDNTEIMPLEDMIKQFTLDKVNNRGAQFNIEKLTWMNGHYIRQKPLDELITLSKPYLEPHFDLSKFEPTKIREALTQQHERLKTLAELPALTKFFFKQDVDYDEKAVNKILRKDGVKDVLQKAKSALEKLDDFNAYNLEHLVTTMATELGLKLQNIAQPIRVAITGGTVSPPINETMHLLGKERVLERLNKAINMI
ncbi:MAG: hypothetical protein A2W05_11610 [Candidatus Schekmanbacteria bacterium RBG_16_38_10]|uniref:Glutamate--tRNA ligase n=1 Tax=Candidatus Schekmanbacteria bacterium RBG_16_38_10 TaxID=1817879 RepID=A0A1F7RVX7_9BACT|nr:MAG: hypothetical protein A2W05_11610 [Candidatus Schekmanbacteria bacterium RBG_16_38_10]